ISVPIADAVLALGARAATSVPSAYIDATPRTNASATVPALRGAGSPNTSSPTTSATADDTTTATRLMTRCATTIPCGRIGVVDRRRSSPFSRNVAKYTGIVVSAGVAIAAASTTGA